MGILEVSNVNKRFGGLQALGNVNLDIANGTVHAIIGPNGAGKSTLLNVLIGKLEPDTGTVLFNGTSVLGRKPYEINQLGISRVFQTPEIFGDLTVFENMLIPCFAKRDGSFRMHALESIASEKDIIEKAEHMLAEVNMADNRHMTASSLSRGDKRRLEMAMCLVQEPKLLLLDEPSLGLAPLIVKQIFEIIKELNSNEGLTVFLVEQNAFHALKLAHRGYVMVNGNITMSGTGAELLKRDEVRAAYLEGGAH